MEIYNNLKRLAKSIKAQNLFVAAKEINGVRIFKNSIDLSKIQSIYLSYLYTYDMIYRDLITEKISEKVLDSEIYEDAYLLWKKKSKHDTIKKDKNNNLKLIPGKSIKFPNKKV